MRHSAVLSYALHYEYEADTQRDEEQNISLPNITLYSGPLLVNTSMCHLKSERKLQHVLFVFQLWSDTRYIWSFIFALRPPSPGSRRGNVLQLSHLIFYFLGPSSAKFRWGRAHLGGRWCDIGNFSLNFLAHFSPLPTFGLAKVCLTMERCKREQSYTLWTSKKKLTLSYWQVRQKKEQTSGEVCPLPEIAAGRKGNLTWH